MSRWIAARFSRNLQHRNIVRQDLGDQLLEPGLTGNRRDMAHERRADPLPLVLIDYGKSHLGLPWLHHDVASAAHDYQPAVLFAPLRPGRRD